MQINTSRFGPLAISPEEIIHFENGLFGLGQCHDWVILADAMNPAIAWLQSVTDPAVAFAVVSPRRFVPDYEIRLSPAELEPLKLDLPSGSHVLVIVGKNDRGMTLNLKAPLVMNLERRLGRQVISNGDQPLQYEIPATHAIRKSA